MQKAYGRLMGSHKVDNSLTSADFSHMTRRQDGVSFARAGIDSGNVNLIVFRDVKVPDVDLLVFSSRGVGQQGLELPAEVLD